MFYRWGTGERCIDREKLGLFLTGWIVFGIVDCMNYTGTITSKGQLTIPAELFRLGKFTKGEKVTLDFMGDYLKITSGLARIRRLAGSLKTPKRLEGLSDNEIRDMSMREHFAKKYAE